MAYSFKIKRQAMYVKYNLTLTRSVTLCWSGKAVSITYCVCSTVLSYAIYSALQYFATLSHKQLDLQKKKKLLSVLWFSLQISCETFLFLRNAERDIIINVYWFSCKVPVILLRLWWKLNFLEGFSSFQASNFMKIRLVVAESFHADVCDSISLIFS
jgi:hypothetical protein